VTNQYKAPRTFVLWFLPVLMLNKCTWGYFWPTYIHHNNVPVLSGPGYYRVVSELRLSHPQYIQTTN